MLGVHHLWRAYFMYLLSCWLCYSSPGKKNTRSVASLFFLYVLGIFLQNHTTNVKCRLEILTLWCRVVTPEPILFLYIAKFQPHWLGFVLELAGVQFQSELWRLLLDSWFVLPSIVAVLQGRKKLFFFLFGGLVWEGGKRKKKWGRLLLLLCAQNFLFVWTVIENSALVKWEYMRTPFSIICI